MDNVVQCILTSMYNASAILHVSCENLLCTKTSVYMINQPAEARARSLHKFTEAPVNGVSPDGFRARVVQP